MNGYDAYKTYQAVRLHFVNNDFDYFKYGGNSKTSELAFNARKDKYTFHKVARVIGEKELPYFFAINFLKRDGKAWIAGMLQEEAFTVFKNWKDWQDKRSENFIKDLKKLAGRLEKFEDIIVVKDNQFPELLNLVFQNEISYDTLIILDHYIKLLHGWDKKIDDDFIWSDFYKKFNKYKPFFLHYAPLSDPYYKKFIVDYLSGVKK
jgi:hypothetical protein